MTDRHVFCGGLGAMENFEMKPGGWVFECVCMCWDHVCTDVCMYMRLSARE